MARVLELINTGSTNLDSLDHHVYNGMLFIIDNFQINIKLEESWIDASTTNLKVQKAWSLFKTLKYKSTKDENDSSAFKSNRHDQNKKAYRYPKPEKVVTIFGFPK